MEILPHLWLSDFYNYDDAKFLKEKKIKIIINVSKNKNFSKNNNRLDIEEIRIPVEYDEEETSVEEMNRILYEYIYDVTDYMHEKIMSNKNILLIGYQTRQDVDVFMVGYFIRYGKIDIHEGIKYLRSKKDNVMLPKCLFYPCLNKFYYELNKNY